MYAQTSMKISHVWMDKLHTTVAQPSGFGLYAALCMRYRSESFLVSKRFLFKCFQSLTFISKLFPGVLTLFLLLRVSGDLKESPNQSILGVQSFGLAGLHCL